MKMGIELECVYNRDLLPKIHLGEYHNGIELDGCENWTGETDGSLRGYDSKFNFPKTAEFVSRATDEYDFIDVIEQFISHFSKNGKYELKEVLEFNDTTGSHIHFSIDDDFVYHDKTIVDVFAKTRKMFRQMVKDSTINEMAKTRILKSYFRKPYALKVTKQNFNSINKYREFNFLSEREGMGVEWRSPTLRGIETWNEFREMINIFVKCVTYTSNNAVKWQKRNYAKIIPIWNADRLSIDIEPSEIEVEVENQINEEVEVDV